MRPTLLLAVCLTAILIAGSALAQTLVLSAPALANVHGRLTARFGVAVEEKPVLKGELEDGVEMVLDCRVKLVEESAYWLDKEITTAVFRSELRYDALTKEFVMTLPDREGQLRNTNLPNLLKEGWGVIQVTLGSWALLDRGQKYSMRLKTSLNEKDAPEGISRFIYFWSWEAGASNSFQLDFTY